MTDITDAIARVAREFRALNMKPPTAILLGDPEDGHRVLCMLAQTDRMIMHVDRGGFGKPVEMADGSIWMEIKLMDIAIRWPANKMAMPDGTWRFV